MGSRAPFLPTTERDKARLQELVDQFKHVEEDHCWKVTHLMLPGVYMSERTKYPTMKLRTPSGDNITQRLSRLMYAYFVGSFDPDLLIRHKCDTPACIRPDHLTPGTALDNAQDMVKAGNRRGKCAGDSNGNVVISDEQVRNIVMPALASGRTAASIARDLGVSAVLISYIKNGHSRTSVTGFTPKPRKKRPGKPKRGPYNPDAPFTEKFLAKFRRYVSVSEAIAPGVTTPCHVFNNPDRALEDGYAYIDWEKDSRRVHHVSFRIRHGRWPRRGLEISHLCRNKVCVNPDHLDEVTRKEHAYYASQRGWLSAGHRGQRNHQVLTDEQIRWVKERLCETPEVTAVQLAHELNDIVTSACIANIRKGKTGQHVEVEGFVPRLVDSNVADAETRKEVVRLHNEEGLTQKQIALRLGRSQSGVRKILAAEGVKLRPKSYKSTARQIE